jgi:hypothetical protein
VSDRALVGESTTPHLSRLRQPYSKWEQCETQSHVNSSDNDNNNNNKISDVMSSAFCFSLQRLPNRINRLVMTTEIVEGRTHVRLFFATLPAAEPWCDRPEPFRDLRFTSPVLPSRAWSTGFSLHFLCEIPPLTNEQHTDHPP